ncbi:hypothetical protein ACQ4PT_053922 [Festuca glaucescens]
MSDASPTSQWEERVVEHFDVASPSGERYIVDDEEMSDVELPADSPAAPSEAFTQPAPPLRKRLAPAVPSDVPEAVVRAVDAVIMGGGVERLREMVTEENGEVSHFIVDVLMITMGGVDGLDEGSSRAPSIMSSSRAAAIAAELVPYLPCGIEPSPRTRMARGLLATLSACTRNRTMCSASGLLAILLGAAEKLFVGMGQSRDWDGTPLVQCIQVLGGHSVSVKDLHSWLLLVKKALGTRWATPLTLALEKAVGCNEAKGPATTFEFDGESSGLLAPGDSRWPFSNGFGFATWIYVEAFPNSRNTSMATVAMAATAASTSGRSSAWSAAAAACTLAGEGMKHMPRLFSFLTADNDGVEAYFHGQFLVVESGTGKGKKASLHFTYEFNPKCWYFVGLEYTSKQGLLGKVESELRLYVDGKLHESCPFEFPRILKPLSFCCIGTNPPPSIAGLEQSCRQCPLFAEMGPIYIFVEPIGPERMTRLASRGGDALPSFSNGAGLPWKASCDHIRELSEDSYALDIETGGSLHLLYHPNLLNGRSCPDASPSGSTESLWALARGGPMALLPLTVSNVEMDNLEPILGDLSLSLATSSLCVPIFRIISLAIQHPGNKEELCHTHGPELLSQVLHYLLETLSKLESGKKEILNDEELVAAIVSLCQSQRNDPGLKVQLFSTLLLDLKMWSSCNFVLQKKLLSSLADMVFAESACMYEANALQMLLDGCRRCYWVTRERDSIDNFTFTETERPLGKVNALVDELLVVIELLIGAASSTMASDDVHRLVGFVVDCPQPNQVARVLLLIYRLIVHPNSTRAQMFAQSFISRGGVEALLVLLQREAKSGGNNIFNSCNVPQNAALWNGGSHSKSSNSDSVLKPASSEANCNHEIQSVDRDELPSHEPNTGLDESTSKWCVLKDQFIKNLGGTDFPNITDNVQNNVYNIDNGDGVLVGIVHVFGALLASGHLKLASPIAKPKLPSGFLTTTSGEGNSMFEDRINISSGSDNVNFHDSGYRFEHIPLLLVLLRSLPYASRAFQARAIQQSEGTTVAASGVAAEVPREAKMQAEKAAHLSVVLAENAIVLMMLVEDHLRSRSQHFFTSCLIDSSVSPASMASSRSLSRTGSEPLEAGGSRQSLSSDAGGLPVDVLASMSDANGQISAEVMERVTAAAAAEPYGSVRHAFVSYGSCISDLSEGWKYRSRLWYGVCIPSKSNIFGGGGSGWEAWKSVVEKDSSGNWIELPLVKKSVAMLQTLLLDSGFGDGLGSGGVSGAGMGVMSALNQLLDSDQPFFCMLRLTLISMREGDNEEDNLFMRNISMKNDISEGLGAQSGSAIALDGNSCSSARKPESALLWRVLGPVLNMPVSESKRQRVLVASSVLYSEVWQAVSSDRKPLRKKYLELIMPPFAAVLKRYRSVLAGIHELTSSDGQNPLVVDDSPSAADALPIEAAVSMISPGWAAAFASPPVAMALAMIAAGASGAETIAPPTNKLRRRDTSLLERRSAKLHTFSSFQRPLDTTPTMSASAPKDKASAKAAALAAARDLERTSKIGSRRGLSAVAMATSGQRRAAGDIERAQRWNTTEAMGAAWMECLQSADSKSVSGRDFSALSYKYVALLVSSFALARNLQRVEISNFDYLMELNTLAGRSYNDITQYPIFPWVVSDYQSKTLDLENPSSYRDLSKVLYYLARIEPFTTLHIQLQGGKFGDDDHMFSDIIRTWNSVLEDMNDVKELVPEMFYLPEVFTYANSVDSGMSHLIKKLGKLIPINLSFTAGSVQLPPWAENPVDFIHKHRKALESDHVSAHLHEWINLIFGYRQRGKEAMMANNVFPYATYEGTVDTDKIADPTIFRNPSEVRSYLLPNPDQYNVPASAILVSNECIVVVDANVPAAHVALHHWQPSTPDDLGTPFLFHHGRNAINSSGGAIRRIFKGPASAEDYHFPRAIAFAASAIQTSSTVVVTFDKEVITGGHADNSVKLISPDGARTIETASGHIAPVTCLALSPDNNYFVTGSRDTTIILWRIHQMSSSHWKNAPEPPPSTPTTPSRRVSCIEVSKDGHFALIGTSLSGSSCVCGDCTATDEDYAIEKPSDDEDVAESKEMGLSVHVPSICFIELHKLEVIHMLKLGEGQDITAVALNEDNTTLVASTADKQLIVFTNPSLNSKIADQMLHEGDGLL